jgi:UDP-sugar transporter A1/2/3
MSEKDPSPNLTDLARPATAAQRCDALPGVRFGVFFFPYRYIALVLLLAQTTSVVLFMRYSLKPNPNEKPYIKTTAVVMAELFKLVASIFLLGYERQSTVFDLLIYLKLEVVDNWRQSVLLGVPAGLYTLQNNLLYIALQNLNGTTYQVTYQLKILTTAVFSVVMLGKKLDATKWLSLLLLTAGVVIVQMPAGGSTTTVTDAEEDEGNPYLGLGAVIFACCTSGFAGVYFEKILKGTKQSVWLRNIQLALFSIVLGAGGCFWNDGDRIAEGGFFQGYTNIVLVVVTLQGLGGLVIATVIKYADNIMKSFAVSISIIITGMISFTFMSDFDLTWNFVMGAMLVIGATFMYTSGIKMCEPKVTVREFPLA